ncbi:terminase [Endozoicomonas sp. G2_1]|uniref:terminase n=1 Tax=Endozoicomonas sp. G2_1 TaxID=2821091 RepID=UPI001ADD503E|nr:terminase [Endozoicomonas sp. G2_1]MBO9492084.1 terminase [Endozoicomonas sp. G2_1]
MTQVVPVEGQHALAENEGSLEFILDNQNWLWRINNLYYITDKRGQKVKFVMNDAQKRFFHGMHTRNIILKARQLGFTTFMMIFMLDAALFNSRTNCGVIAHTKDDANRLFDEKIKFAYDNLPKSLRDRFPALTDRAGQIKFPNKSKITVGSSFRGGTFQYLHISEFGKICAKYPERAREIVTGAFESVGADCVITIESTAEGRQGYFFDLCQVAEQDQLKGKELSFLDWEFFFYPWYKDTNYRLESKEPLPMRIIEYFDTLRAKHKLEFTQEQMNWYYAKEKLLGHDVKREYPTTPQEAFEQVIEGAYYSSQFRKLYENNQITSVPYEPTALVHTFWDIGFNDDNVIWFIQQIGREYRVINYYENHGEGLPFYVDKLRELSQQYGYQYGIHMAPHDIGVHEWGTGMSRLEQADQLGLHFETAPKLSIMDGIEAVRAVLPMCWFDEVHCEQGISGLQNYRKEWDDKYGVWKNRPAHDSASHCADGFRTFAVALRDIQNRMGSVVHGSFTDVEQVDVSYWC